AAEVKHALAVESRAERDAAEPAPELPHEPRLEGVRPPLRDAGGRDPAGLGAAPEAEPAHARHRAAAHDPTPTCRVAGLVPAAGRSRGVVTGMSDWPGRSVRLGRGGRWKRSSGSTPRGSGSIQKRSGSSADSAIGNSPAA